MPLTTEQINAEKRTKSRPDLIPAEVLGGFFNAMEDLIETLSGSNYYDEDEEEEFETEDYAGLDPTIPLIEFAQTGDVNFLFRAMAKTAGRRIARGLHGHALAMGRVLAYGLEKHGVCTWRVAGTEQADPQTHYASALRHLLEDVADGDAVEEGSGFPVIDHALTQMAILADLVMNPPQLQGQNDGQWAIASSRALMPKPVPELPVESLPEGYSWEDDMNQRQFREYIKGPTGAVWFDDEGRLMGSLSRDKHLVAILRRRHGVTA